MSSGIYGGVEGGGSKSFLTLIRGDGQTLCEIIGPATNHWAVGMKKCCELVYELIQEGFIKCELDKNTKLESLGLSLSGCEDEKTNLELKETFSSKYPDLAKSVSIGSDTVAAVLTASPKGGVVLIAGTGSNSLLLNEDGSSARCGGWGHVIGDEGGAFWIAINAVKHVFNEEDNFNVPEYDCKSVKKAMYEHFKISNKEQILRHCYTEFDKSFFAALTEKLAKVAHEENDPLCCDLFRRAGKDLGTYVRTVSPHIKIDYTELEGGFPVVCVGSVFKSWDLLKEGFLEGLNGKLSEFTLLRLKVSAAFGATYLGAKESGFHLPINFRDNVEVMFHHKI